MNDIIKDAESKMLKGVVALKSELGKLRTGRAHPSLLEHIKIDYYGTETPLNQVATVAVDSARCLSVTPWERQLLNNIEKAIQNSDLGLNPVSVGTAIRVPLPALTEERRKELVRVVREEGEKARVGIRNIRRDANQTIKELLKKKEATEDDSRRIEQEIQALTNKVIAQVDELIQHKESGLMSV